MPCMGLGRFMWFSLSWEDRVQQHQLLQAAGVLVKDLDRGLLDFPSRREGRDILLCWHVGEEEIRYWHGIDEGFAGRKPI